MNKILLFLFLLCCCFNFSALSQDKWEYLPNIGLDTSKNIRFEDVFFTSYYKGFAVDLSGYTHRTTDGGQNWSLVAGGGLGASGNRSIEFLNDGKTGISGSFGGTVARTDDSGETWVNISSSIPDTSKGFTKYGICGIAHIDNSFMAVGIYGSTMAHFYRSDDRGLSWSVKYLDTALVSGLVDVVFTSSDTGVICGFKRYTGKGEFGVVLKTYDGGKNWRKVFESPNRNMQGIWKLQFIGSNFGVGAIQSFDTIAMIKTTDAGEHWSVLGTGYSPLNFVRKDIGLTQSIGFVTPLKGWMGGYFNSIIETNDGGITWDSLSFGSCFNRIFVMDTKHAYAGGRSVYRYGSDFTVGVPHVYKEVTLPHTLYSVTPNPGSGKIKIEFELSTRTNAIVQVFHSATGRVWDIHRERMNPGHYTFYWQDATAPAGEYFVRLNNDEVPMIQKFILVK